MKPVGIARYVLHGASEERQELVARNKQLITIRWVYVTIIAGTAIVAALLAHKPSAIIGSYFAIAGLIYTFNAILFAASRFTGAPISYHRAIAIIQIVTDLTLSTFAVIVQGGIEARTTILYVIPIINAVMLFRSAGFVMATALVSAVCYIVAVLSVAFTTGSGFVTDDMLVPFIFYSMLFLLIARLLDYLNARNINQARDTAYDELLALLSHQLRHPASTISAIVDTIYFDKSLKYDKETKRYLDILNKENDRQIHLINNLLEVVGADSPSEKLQVADVDKILSDAVASQGIAHRRTDDMRLQHKGKGKLTVYGSTEKLRMVVDNLLDNALRYSDKGTKVETSVLTTSSQVIITISDHGVGILPGHRRQIFKKFGSTAAFDGEVHGAGLGMYVSEKIVKAYGGELSLRSSVGGGTQVTIKLQRTDND